MSLSTTGSAHVVALYVDFPSEYGEGTLGFEYGDTPEALQALIGKSLDSETYTTNSAYAPYDSVNAYYQRSSYGALDISGTVFTYTAQNPRSYYTYDIDALFAEALNSLDGEVNFSGYDANDDGYIDGVYLHFAGPNEGWGTTWWSNESFYKGNQLYFDDKLIGGTITLHNPSNSADGISTAIHETGHLLGLPDYCSYNSYLVDTDPSGRTGILTFDMMNSNVGDHNAYSSQRLRRWRH